MKTNIIKKIKSKNGESLVETLTAILIISLTFAFLCNTIVTANKINQSIKEKHPEMSYDGTDGKPHSIHFQSSNTEGIHSSDSVQVYEDSTGNYMYYIKE